MNRRLEERRAQHQHYKRDVQERGKPFYPYAMFHDTMMSLIVVSVIVGLACLWYFTTSSDPAGCDKPHGDSCLLGKRYDAEADPGTTSFIPRPDWYFYFLFYLLRIFKWPDSVILGTVGIPTIALVLLLVLPFLDLRRERRPLRRPVAMVAAILTVISMGTLTYKGATASEALGVELVRKVPVWAKKEGYANNPTAVAGATIFAKAGCTSCHTYLGDGTSNLGAPDLSAEGAKGKGIDFQIRHLKCPSCVTPGSAMRPFAGLGEDNLRTLAVFLEASKGPK